MVWAPGGASQERHVPAANEVEAAAQLIWVSRNRPNWSIDRSWPVSGPPEHHADQKATLAATSAEGRCSIVSNWTLTQLAEVRRKGHGLIPAPARCPGVLRASERLPPQVIGRTLER